MPTVKVVTAANITDTPNPANTADTTLQTHVAKPGSMAQQTK